MSTPSHHHDGDDQITSLAAVRSELKLKLPDLPASLVVTSGSGACSLSHNDDGHGLRNDVQITLPTTYGELQSLLGAAVLDLRRPIAAGIVRVLTGHEAGHVLDTISGCDLVTTGANPNDIKFRGWLSNVVDDIAIDCGLIDKHWPALVHLQPLLNTYLGAAGRDYGVELTSPELRPPGYVKHVTYAWLHWARTGALKVHGHRTAQLPHTWAQPFFDDLRALVPRLIDSLGSPDERLELFERSYQILRDLGLEATTHLPSTEKPDDPTPPSTHAINQQGPLSPPMDSSDHSGHTDPAAVTKPDTGEIDLGDHSGEPGPDPDSLAAPGHPDDNGPASTSTTHAEGAQGDDTFELDEAITGHENTLGDLLDPTTPSEDIVDAMNRAAEIHADLLDHINDELARADLAEARRRYAAEARLAQDHLPGVLAKAQWQQMTCTPVTPSAELLAGGAALASALRTVLRQVHITRAPGVAGSGLDLSRPECIGRAIAGVPNQPIWRAKLREVERPEGLDVIVALDASGSMGDEEPTSSWSYARTGLELVATATTLLPQVRLGLIVFGTQGYVFRHLDDPWHRAMLPQLLGDLAGIIHQPIGRGTYVTPAIHWASTEFSRTRWERRQQLLVLITDGQLDDDDTNSAAAHSLALSNDTLRVGVAFPGAQPESFAQLVDAIVDLRANPAQLSRVLSTTMRRVLAHQALTKG